MIILIDMDGVVADLLSKWLAAYNATFNDTLMEKDILSWDLHKYATRCSAQQFYSLIDEPDFSQISKSYQTQLKYLKDYRKSILYIS